MPYHYRNGFITNIVVENSPQCDLGQRSFTVLTQICDILYVETKVDLAVSVRLFLLKVEIVHHKKPHHKAH